MLTDKVFVCDLLTVNRELTLFDVHQLFLLSNIHSTTHFTSVYMYKIISILISNHRRNVKPEEDDEVTEASTPAPPTELTTNAHETTPISITTLPQTTELITSTDPSTTTSRVVDTTVAMDKVEPRALN